MVFSTIVSLSFADVSNGSEYEFNHSLSISGNHYYEYGLWIEKQVKYENREKYKGILFGSRPLINLLKYDNNIFIESQSKFSIPALLYFNSMSKERMIIIDDFVSKKWVDKNDLNAIDYVDIFVSLVCAGFVFRNYINNLEIGYRFKNSFSMYLSNQMHYYNDDEFKSVGVGFGYLNSKLYVNYLYHEFKEKTKKISVTIETSLKINSIY